MKYYHLVRWLGLLPLLAACSATDYMTPARDAYSAGDYATADRLVTELVLAGDSNVHVFQLEQGMTHLAVGAPDLAIKAWRKSRDRLDKLAGSDFLETAAAWLSDDTALDYEGATFERVLVRAMLAVAELIAPGRLMGDDALAYANQVGVEQRKIIDELRRQRDDLDGQSLIAPDVAFKFVAFGNYIAAMIREADPLTVDAALFQMRRACEIEPDRQWMKDELKRLESGRFSQNGQGVVHILGLLGRGPYRVEDHVDGSQEAFQLAQAIIAAISGTWPQASLKGVPINRLAFHNDNPDTLRVLVDGIDHGTTLTVTDVEDIAQREFEATYNYRVARALVRRAIKVGVTEATREIARAADSDGQHSTKGQLTDLGITIIGSLWQATEVADLRCWSLLPANFQVLRIGLEPGVHEIALQPMLGGVTTGPPQTIIIKVISGRPTYVLSLCPTSNGGAPLLSRDYEQADP